MSSKGGGSRKIILIGLIVLIAAGAALFVYLHFFHGKKQERTLGEVLSAVDASVEKGFFPQAEDQLKKLKKFSGDSTSWMRILKRAEAISRGAKDYSLLRDYGKAATEDLPGNKDLWALYVYSLLKTGKYQEAFKLADKYLHDERYLSLLVAAVIDYGPESYDTSSFEKTKYWTLFKDGENAEPRYFEEMAGTLHDERLYAAAAIKWMLAGKPEEAYEDIMKVEDESYELLRFFVLYDSGHQKVALGMLDGLTARGELDFSERLLLEADIEMSLGNYERAGIVYREVIKKYPDKSWIPYLNLAWLLNREKGDVEEGPFDYLMQAYEHFPEKQEVAIALSLFLLQQNFDAAEKSALEKIEKKLSSGDELQKMLLSTIQTSQNPERYKAMLWELYNAYPGNVKISQYFAWYLLGLHDLESLRTLLGKITRYSGEMEWADFFYGTMYSLEGKTKEAEEAYQRSLEKNRRWETLYDMAMLSLQSGDSDTALSDFREAESVLGKAAPSSRGASSPPASSSNTVVSKELAQIRVKIAWILFLDDQYASASRQLDYALDIDPSNLEGLLLKKKLEAQTKR